tara:strand:+ start:358 stop:744 length:387 start_codon:yes stop_codon:yes gene_type:complete
MVLPKSMRLKGYKCFNYLYQNGTKFNGDLMLLRVVTSKPKLLKSKSLEKKKNSLRFAISISHKISKKAVIRNKLRRLFHDHLREKLYGSDFRNNYWALLSLKPNKSYENSLKLLQELDKLLLKAGLLS